MKRIHLILMALAPVLWIGCKEEGRIDHIDPNAPAPAQVTITDSYGTPGGAVLKYAAPAGGNLLYVRAEYETQPGVVRECRSSFYKDSLVLEGFGDVRVYDVKVYSVGKNEKASEPLTIQVIPTTAPVHMATKVFKETFGGVSVIVENPERASLAVELMGDTARLGYQIHLATYYTSREKAVFVFRGLRAVPYDFSVYLRDRWGNLSTVAKATVTPVYDEFIPKNTWAEYDLPGDAPYPAGNFQPYRLSSIWKDPATTSNSQYAMYTPVASYFPYWNTWDMGLSAVIGRIKIWYNSDVPHMQSEHFKSGFKIFELWGSSNPNLDGSWNSWIPLGRFEIEKPSPGETVTEEDLEAVRAGFDFDVMPDEFAIDPLVPVRYIRLKSVAAWSGVPFGEVNYRQISFWGTVVERY